jgi:hypothetical protein
VHKPLDLKDEHYLELINTNMHDKEGRPQHQQRPLWQTYWYP